MRQLGNGLSAVHHYEDALAVQEAELSMLRRLGASEANILDVHCNLAMTYAKLGRIEEASRMLQGAYSGQLKLNGGENADTLAAANNYATSLIRLKRFEEAKALLRKSVPVARRILGERVEITINIRSLYAQALCRDANSTLDDLREALETFEDTERTARRVFGDTHPLTEGIEGDLGRLRAALAASEAQVPGDLCEALGAL